MTTELRLSEFCSIIKEPRETVRAIMNRDDAPFAREGTGGGSQRTYSGRDLICWFGFQALRDAGVLAHRAAHLMRYSGAVDEFIKALADGQDMRDFCLIHGEDHMDPTSEMFRLHYSFGKAEVVAALVGEWNATGPKTKYVVAVPFWQVYLTCLQQVAAHGFRLEGLDLVEVEE